MIQQAHNFKTRQPGQPSPRSEFKTRQPPSPRQATSFQSDHASRQVLASNPSFGSLLPPPSPAMDWRAGGGAHPSAEQQGRHSEHSKKEEGQALFQPFRQVSAPWADLGPFHASKNLMPTPRIQLAGRPQSVTPAKQQDYNNNNNNNHEKRAHGSRGPTGTSTHSKDSTTGGGNTNNNQAAATSSSNTINADGVLEIDFNELEIVESLGNGEFGQVFRGRWKGQDVAVKALYQKDMKTSLLDLKKEIDSFRHLDHKRLVKFLGACFTQHLCFITEYMPNGSLYNFLHTRKIALPTKHALNMTTQLVEGVHYLHTRDPIVVHRDLKSLNVVLDLKFNIKLCDFGLTEQLDINNRQKHNGGSPRYMAPELFEKKLKISEKIDIWAMACIIAEIWGGSIPYDGVKDMPTLTNMILNKKQPPAIPSIIPLEEVKEILQQCFNFDPEQRPRTSRLLYVLYLLNRQGAGGRQSEK